MVKSQRKKLVIRLVFVFFMFIINPLRASDFPKIFGCFCEGGIITGNIGSSNSIKINGKKQKIFEDGNFIFAFGRKFSNKVLVSYNGIKKEFDIKKKKYKIEIISGLPKRKVQPTKTDLEKIFEDKKKIVNAKKIGVKKKIFEKKFILPAEGRISGVYGSQRILNDKPRSPHNGIDIAAKEGTNIFAPSSGVVKLIEKNMFFTGKTVIMDHGMGLISIFAHLSKIEVTENQILEKGDKIGQIGMTGRATGPHLHWGMYLENESVDPMSVVESSFF